VWCWRRVGDLQVRYGVVLEKGGGFAGEIWCGAGEGWGICR
jgi:hypothetical protein